MTYRTHFNHSEQVCSICVLTSVPVQVNEAHRFMAILTQQLCYSVTFTWFQKNKIHRKILTLYRPQWTRSSSPAGIIKPYVIALNLTYYHNYTMNFTMCAGWVDVCQKCVMNWQQKRTEQWVHECVKTERTAVYYAASRKVADQRRRYILLLFFISCFLCFIQEHYCVFLW